MIHPFRWKTLTALLVVWANCYVFAADRYWIGNNTSKNWNTTANWSTTSGGSGGASVPGTSDDVYFNGGGTGQCNANVSVSVRKLTIDSTYTDTIKQGNHFVVGTGGYLQNGGTFVGFNVSPYYMTVQGTFTLNKGTFKSPSSRLNVQNNFTVSSSSSAIFEHSNGEVFFTGVYTIKAAITLYKCTFYPLSGVGGSFILDPTTVLTVENLLSSLGIGLFGTGYINAHGDVTQGGGTIVTGGTATIHINGSANQTFIGHPSSSAVNFHGSAVCNININKSNSSTLSLTGHIVIGGNWVNQNNTTIAPGTSTILFFGSKTITETQEFNNVVFYSPSSASTTSITTGTKVVANGKLSMGGASVGIYGGNIEARGDIDAITYASGYGFVSGTSNLLINGTGNQKLTGYSGNTIGIEGFRNITVAKTSGILTLEGIITVNGNWTVETGSVIQMNDDPSLSNLAFTGIAITGPNHELKNVTFYAPSGLITHTVSTSTVLTVTKNLTLQSFGSGRLNMNGGTVEAKGDIKILTGNGTSGSTSGGNTLLKINGDGNQTIIGTSAFQAQTLFPHVEINKLTGTLTLDGFMTAGGNWTCTSAGAGIVPGNSTLAFAGGTTITGSHNLNDLMFNALISGANTMNIASGTTLSVARDLIIMGAGGTVINTGTINVERNITISSTSNLGGGSGLININGTGDQTLTGTTTLNTGYLCRVKIDKITGTLTVKNKAHIAANFTYTQGNIDLTTHQSTFVFSGTGTITTNSKYLNNVSFYSSTSTIPAADPLNVDGELRFENGSGIIINTGTINARGNIFVPNLVSVAGGGTGKINICGSTNQAFSGNTTATLRGSLCNVTIDKPSGTLILSNIITMAATSTWTYVQGIVDPGTSLVVVISGATINCGTVAANMEFYDFRIQGGSVTTNLSGLLNVKRHLTVDQARSLTTNNYNITVGGNFSSLGLFTAGTCTVTLNGSGRQVISTSSFFHNLKVDKPSGKVYPVTHALNVGNNLSLVKGVIASSGSAPLRLHNNATLTGGSNQSYVAGAVTKIGDDAFTFPLGDTTLPDTSAYHPFAMTAPTGVTSSFTAQYYAKNVLTDYPSYTSIQSSLKGISNCEYWSLVRNVGTAVVLPTLSWNKNSCNSGVPEELRVGGWDGSQWKNMGQSNLSGNASAGSITAVSPGVNTSNQYYVLATVPHPVVIDTRGLDSLVMPDTLKYTLSGAGLSGTYIAGGLQNVYPDVPATGSTLPITLTIHVSGQSVQIGLEITPTGLIKNPHVILPTGPTEPPCSIWGCLELDNNIKINECLLKNCLRLSTTVYAVLNRKPDGGYFQIINGDFHFRFDEAYNDTDGKLRFRLYNNDHKLLLDTKTLPLISQRNGAYGTTYYAVNLLGCYDHQPLGSGYYMIEVENEKQEVWMARLKNVIQGPQPACESIPIE